MMHSAYMRKLSLILCLLLSVNQINSPDQIKANSNGNREIVGEWSYRFGTYGTDEPRSLIQTNDGGITFVYESIEPNYHQSRVVHVNKNGEKQWEQEYYNVSIYELQQSTDNGYILAGRQFDNPWFARTGEDGVLLWDNIYRNIGSFNTVIKTSDGGFAFAGWM
ncbi:MAG: hypothetical protein ACXAD7_26670, partial [Candidatus Kariarchaeaceae archaeon]